MVGMQVPQPQQPSRFRGGGNLVSDFSAIVRKEGWGSLYSGLRPTLWRDVPFSAIYWLCLEQMRDAWNRKNAGDLGGSAHHQPLSPIRQASQAFVNGAVSGMVAAACTTPFDVVKTRQQQFQQEITTERVAAAMAASESTTATAATAALCTHDGAVAFEHPNFGNSSAASRGTSTTSSTFDQLRQIARTEGIQGLWRGNQARMLKVAPACAIMISSYEFGKRILEE